MFCPQFRPIVGGAERQAEKLARALAGIGWSVRILTPRMDPDSPSREEAAGVSIERFPYVDLASRYHVPGIGALNVPYILWQTARAVRPSLAGASVLHCHLASLQTVGAALAGRAARIPVLCKAATAGERSDLGQIEATGRSGRFVAWLARMSIGTWVATTAAVADALVRAGMLRSRIVRIPNGVEPAPPAVAARRGGGARRFLSMGRVSVNAARDLPTLVQAFDALAGDHPDVELAIVGGGDLLASTRDLAAACASRDRILLPGFDDPAKWLAWADCFVLPSRREGLSNALLEAMSAGLPCIANDIAPNRETLDDGVAGVLVPVGDAGALEAALRAMADDPALAARFGAQARARVERCYTIGAVAARYAQLYAGLAA
ncbi:MAG TPA: glycosyltransferase family 4 protein [Casimicrobiaceae bacterium]|nr:glycosyltransferase family 4 protein [Casimicrobiaceae bacterium]